MAQKLNELAKNTGRTDTGMDTSMDMIMGGEEEEEFLREPQTIEEATNKVYLTKLGVELARNTLREKNLIDVMREYMVIED